MNLLEAVKHIYSGDAVRPVGESFKDMIYYLDRNIIKCTRFGDNTASFIPTDLEFELIEGDSCCLPYVINTKFKYCPECGDKIKRSV